MGWRLGWMGLGRMGLGPRLGRLGMGLGLAVLGLGSLLGTLLELVAVRILARTKMKA